MQNIRVIPCLDVKSKRVVKGVNFVNLKDAGDPVELAKFYNDEGADELVFLDITASSDERDTILDVVYKTAEEVFIPLTVGGGIRTIDDARKILKAGADKVSVNSAALSRPNLVSEIAYDFGNQCVVVAIDARKTSENGWEIYTHGGRNPTGIDALIWAVTVEGLGAGELLVTSMDKDGTQDGYDLSLLAELNKRVNIPIVASGGVGKLSHFIDGVKIGHADALLAASVFHFGTFSIADTKKALVDAGISVRV